jgi:hypothetical protein
VNRQRNRVVEYLLEENRVLREQLGGRRLHLTDDQRRRLAVKGKILGQKVLQTVAGIVTPDTILRWYVQPSILQSARFRRHHLVIRQFPSPVPHCLTAARAFPPSPRWTGGPLRVDAVSCLADQRRLKRLDRRALIFGRV